MSASRQAGAVNISSTVGRTFVRPVLPQMSAGVGEDASVTSPRTVGAPMRARAPLAASHRGRSRSGPPGRRTHPPRSISKPCRHRLGHQRGLRGRRQRRRRPQARLRRALQPDRRGDLASAAGRSQYRSARHGHRRRDRRDALTGSVPAKAHYLVQQSAGTAGTTHLPTPRRHGHDRHGRQHGTAILLQQHDRRRPGRGHRPSPMRRSSTSSAAAPRDALRGRRHGAGDVNTRRRPSATPPVRTADNNNTDLAERTRPR